MIHAKDINEQSPWQEMTPGGEIYEGGTARMTLTGQWRSDVPVWMQDQCKQCLMCVPFCPDSSIPVVNGKRTDFDYDHCKGCGICMSACPFEAIRMEKEVHD
ncbi:MAG: 4Fe-4S binding protein [Erysipelotrichaceae bacterium]|jgi:pyruvate ferredoxin oxidoreductase delta subunit|nr:4Fe-4S binding protein [Erysipelotrichaceae bacterium]